MAVKLGEIIKLFLEKKEWKKQAEEDSSSRKVSLIQRINKGIITTINPDYYQNIQEDHKKAQINEPDIWDGVRALNDILDIDKSAVAGTLSVTAKYHDPEIAAKLVEYYLVSLNEHLSSEAKQAAEINRKFLEKQLDKTSDPIVRNKIYSMIAQEIEAAMMSDVKENFGFKVIDPPRIPGERLKVKKEKRTMIVSFIASLFFGIFLIFFLEYIKKKKIEEETDPETTDDHGVQT